MILTAIAGTLLKAFEVKRPQQSRDQMEAEVSKNLSLAFDELAKKFPNNYTVRRAEYLRKNGLPEDYTLRPSGRKSAFHKDI